MLFLFGSHMTLLPTELNVKGKIKWDSAIGQVSDSHSEVMTESGTPSCFAQGNEESFFRCPRCEIAVRSTSAHFQVEDLDRKACCRGCAKSTPIKDWTCECNAKWHVCKVHGGLLHHLHKAEYSSPQGQPPPSVKKSSGAERKLHILDQGSHGILADDIRWHSERKMRLCASRDDSHITLSSLQSRPLKQSFGQSEEAAP